ncbi:MAG: hypothetical protein ABJ387_06980 [Balneola sp.]
MRPLILSIFLLIALNCTSNKEYSVKEFTSPSGENASLPRLFTDNTGTVFLSWVESKGDTSSLFYSKLDDDQWSKPKLIAKSDSWFVNWADFPSVIGKDGKAVAAHWLQKVPGGTYAYNVNIAGSANDWENVLTPHKDNTPTEHGFVSLTPASDSTFLSIWLDGRNTAGSGGHESHTSGLSSAMTLRSAFINNDLKIEESFLIDASVCDCCGTAAVKTKNGFIAAYRDRTEDEIRDIYISRFMNGKWEKPVSVHDDNWEIAACPVNGPAIAAQGQTLAVAWYTGAGDTTRVKLAFSNDEGKSFETPVLLDNGNPLGRVDVEFISNNEVLVSWMERNMENRSKAFFVAKRISTDGEIQKEFEFSLMESSRKSGFPQISSYKNSIIAAWADVSDQNSSKIKVAILE